VLFLGITLFLSGCSRPAERDRNAPAPGTDAARAAAPAEPAPPASATPADDGAPRIIFLGDSLTAGLGVDVEQSFPSLIQARLTREHLRYKVVNAGVSGDTSAGGLSRLDWSLDGDVRVLIVALGGNDGLRGLPVQQLKQNLSQIIERARARRITVMLAGMEAPPNHGWEYVVDFHQVFADLAKKYQVPFVPFLALGALEYLLGGDALLDLYLRWMRGGSVEGTMKLVTEFYGVKWTVGSPDYVYTDWCDGRAD